MAGNQTSPNLDTSLTLQLAGNLYLPHFEASTNGIYCGKSNQSKFGHVSDSIERVKTPHSCTRDKPPCPDKAHSRTTSNTTPRQRPDNAQTEHPDRHRGDPDGPLPVSGAGDPGAHDAQLCTACPSSEIVGNQTSPNVDTSSRSKMAGNLYQAHFEPSSIFVLQVQMEFIAGNQTSPNLARETVGGKFVLTSF